ncbi:hypothetical protein K9L67_03010 [Candidatus Woesearchaeota archaeon]|nr:hypothetical protein [Candidatus Woesearchaeota archaeon]MCF7901171.1 hypothetical protein [Candidatus Woesearchaeota archaeon]MCF8013815.1 hypothetical protein [Candidatus Woesearchaeota archaeon]
MKSKAVLYKKVRNLLFDKLTHTEIIDKLSNKYNVKDIQDQINEVYKDENTDYDDKLILEMNELLKQNNMYKVIDILKAKGHSQFEINKAIMRLDEIQTKKIINKKSYLKLVIFIIPIFLTFTYSMFYMFIIAFMSTSLISYELFKVKNAKRNIHNMHNLEIDLTWSAGLWISQGNMLYTASGKPIPKFWTFNQGLLLAIVFIVIGIMDFSISNNYSVLFLNILNGFIAYALLYYEMPDQYYPLV